jgi:hypothetical protein
MQFVHGASRASVVLGANGEILTTIADLSQPAFWATPHAFEGPDDWLGLPKKDGAFELLSIPALQMQPILAPGSLGADGQADVRWGAHGDWIATPSLAQLQNQVSFAQGYFAPLLGNGPNVQNLASGAGGGPASRDFHQSYFQVLDGVPGGPSNMVAMPYLLGFQVQEECSDCLEDGLELTILDTWFEKFLPQGVVLLNTSEAYAWNPAQPGLLVIAEGGSLFTFEHKRLVLLDVPAGQIHLLTGGDQVVFEPAWSPDGRRLAYTALPAGFEPAGSDAGKEALLGGRAITVHDLPGEMARPLTSPAGDEIDGWPRWAADGKSVLFASKRLADGATEIRRLEIESGTETLLRSIAGAPLDCHAGGCGWEQMLAYSPGSGDQSPAAAGPVLAPTPTPAILADAPQPGWNTYTDAGYGFSFQHPADWQVFSTQTNSLQVGVESTLLTVGYRRASQPASIQRTGVGGGDFADGGSVMFLGQTLKRTLLVYGGKVKAVFYHSASEFAAGDLIFTLSVDDFGEGRYEDVDIPQDVQDTMDRIVQSFQFE